MEKDSRKEIKRDLRKQRLVVLALAVAYAVCLLIFSRTLYLAMQTDNKIVMAVGVVVFSISVAVVSSVFALLLHSTFSIIKSFKAYLNSK